MMEVICVLYTVFIWLKHFFQKNLKKKKSVFDMFFAKWRLRFDPGGLVLSGNIINSRNGLCTDILEFDRSS